MDETEIKAIHALKNLPILDEDEPSAKTITEGSSAYSVAEAEDMTRLHDLLHRDEYRPLVAIRYRQKRGKCICVYFTRLDDTG